MGSEMCIRDRSSISRLTTELLDEPHQQSGMLIRQLYSTYLENRDLIQTGMYQAGSSALTDLAIRAWPVIQDFIRQPRQQKVSRRRVFEPFAEHGDRICAKL